MIGSDFDLFYQNAALYHESYFNFGKWRFTAGVRLDYEYQHMSYDSRATIHYALLPRMTEYRELNTVFQGSQNNSWLQFVPKVAARYGTDYSYWFASASKGFCVAGEGCSAGMGALVSGLSFSIIVFLVCIFPFFINAIGLP